MRIVGWENEPSLWKPKAACECESCTEPGPYMCSGEPGFGGIFSLDCSEFYIKLSQHFALHRHSTFFWSKFLFSACSQPYIPDKNQWNQVDYLRDKIWIWSASHFMGEHKNVSFHSVHTALYSFKLPVFQSYHCYKKNINSLMMFWGETLYFVAHWFWYYHQGFP